MLSVCGVIFHLFQEILTKQQLAEAETEITHGTPSLPKKTIEVNFSWTKQSVTESLFLSAIRNNGV